MVGEMLKTRRKELDFTQQQVADALHVTRQTVSNWENEKSYPDVFMLIELSDFLKLSLDELIKGDVKLVEKIKNDTTMHQLIQQGIFLLVVCLAVTTFSVFSLSGLVNIETKNGLTILTTDPLLQLTMVIAVVWMIVIYRRNFYEAVEHAGLKAIHRVIQVFLAVSLGITVCGFVLTILSYAGIIVFV